MIHYANWVSLGDKAKAKTAMGWLDAAIIVSSLTWWNIFSESFPAMTIPLNLLFLGAWYFIGARPQIHHINSDLKGRYLSRSWAKPLAASICFLLVLVSFVESPMDFASKLHDLPVEEAMNEAKSYVVGTWTYTATDYQFFVNEPLGLAKVNGWLKWVVNADGTMQMFRARPQHDNWGEGDKTTWTIKTGKYNNTGNRYYELAPKSLEFYQHIVITRDGRLEYKIDANHAVTLERGDRFPFSK
ncbi:hypothetical protein [Brevifollis gellanilyticus]|nr:hypothetical protein [Brevifollis gellanilyticus]